MLKRLRNLRSDERGMSFAFVGIGLMTFMAATTLAIDVGMFMTARTQAQNSADAGALAGATALVFNSWSDRSASGPAVQSSMSTATQNTVMNGVVSVQPTDVTFPVGPTGSNRVKVDVYRTAGRSNPVTTLLGSLLGISTIDIAATATAEAAPAGGMTCVKPFIIPDKWQELTNPPWNMNTSVYDHYDNQGNELNPHDVYDPTKGYSMADKGTLLILRSGSGNNIEPTFYFSWSMPGNNGEIGADWYEHNIAECNTTVIERGEIAIQEPGNIMGPTISGLQALKDSDPTAYWQDDATGGHYVSTKNPSPRVFPIPLYNPDEYDLGKKTGRNATLVVTGFIGFFLEDIKGNEAYGRIFPITGVTSTSAPTPTTPLAYVIHLVQ
jgi:putative Flp pilus-assembly TadE/G-like protein